MDNGILNFLFMAENSQIVVRARGLTKKFGELVAVDHIDFSIYKGKCFGFLGPNGAGKTTTMRMIYLLSELTGGELHILNESAHTIHDTYRLKSRMGVVSQEDNLDVELTTGQTLEVFCRFYGIYGETAKSRVEKLLADVGLGHKIHAKVSQLSGGMKRRLQIARAMIGEPELLILDEPTTGLDPQMRNELWNHLKKLKQKGVTIVLTTHYMQEAEQLCDELVIMDMGKIIAQGHPRQLIKQHVSPFVVEVIFENGLTVNSPELQLSHTQFEECRDLADRRLFYTKNGEALIHDVMSKNPQAMIYQRPATLDDVFIKITGKSLDK